MAEDPELLRAIDRLTAIVESHQLVEGMRTDGFLSDVGRAAKKKLYKTAPSQVPEVIKNYSKDKKTWLQYKKDRDDGRKGMDGVIDLFFDNNPHWGEKGVTEIKPGT